ncbi:MAG: VPLPA-CTERM sorting domain-containing protein [Gammaproteobacteria bacterium]|nr:VPLPA-CTERM sorting domain-containing protein [Gammaproteobacteria bacterium]
MDIFDNGFYVDYTDATFWGPAAYNGFVLTDVGNAIADFTTFNYTLDTNMGGLTLASLNITENGLGINWQNLSFDANTYVKLTMSAVPIPAAVWLFGTALIGLVGFGKRRKAA